MLIVRLVEYGEFIKIFYPQLFKYLDGSHKLTLMQTLLLVSWETKMLQWEYDPTEGEIRAMVEFPLADAVLSRRQFERALTGLMQMVEAYHPRLEAVIETGVDPGRASVGADADVDVPVPDAL